MDFAKWYCCCCCWCAAVSLVTFSSPWLALRGHDVSRGTAWTRHRRRAPPCYETSSSSTLARNEHHSQHSLDRRTTGWQAAVRDEKLRPCACACILGEFLISSDARLPARLFVTARMEAHRWRRENKKEKNTAENKKEEEKKEKKKKKKRRKRKRKETEGKRERERGWHEERQSESEYETRKRKGVGQTGFVFPFYGTWRQSTEIGMVETGGGEWTEKASHPRSKPRRELNQTLLRFLRARNGGCTKNSCRFVIQLEITHHWWARIQDKSVGYCRHLPTVVNRKYVIGGAGVLWKCAPTCTQQCLDNWPESCLVNRLLPSPLVL